MNKGAVQTTPDLPLATLVERLDWGTTPLGPRERWPASLATCERLCLESRFPIILFWGPELVQIYNDAYRPILADRHPAALGQRAADCWHDIWDAIGPMLAGVMRDGVATWSEDLLLPITRDGVPEERFFTFSYSPAREAGTIAGVFCAVQETTAIVRSVREATARSEALAALDRTKTAFYHNVSHELRTPITLMLGPAIDRLREGVDDPTLRDDLDMMVRNGRRLQRLVDTLLDFSRIEADRLSLVRAPVDVGALTRDLASMFESAMQAAGLRFVVETPADLAPVMLDARLWEHVVYNLLSNAHKFTFEGEVRLSLETMSDTLILTVRDTGVGLAEGEAAHVFDRFWRSSGQRSRSHEGSGIGLAFVAEIARLHDGIATFESAPGRGSTVTFAIPSIAAPAHATVAPRAAAPADAYLADVHAPNAIATTTAKSGAPRLLVVDDNADLRAYMMRVLGEFYDVAVADTGSRALDAALTLQPDLVLSDIMMPDMDGIALVQALREQPATAATPVLLVSARADDDTELAGLQAGADGYLLKPFSSHELLVRVDRELTRARLREAEWLHFRAIADAIVHIVYTHAPDGSVDWANRRWHDFSRLPPDIARTPAGWASISPPDDHARLLATLEHAFATLTPYEIEVRYKPFGEPDTALRWHLLRAVPMFDDAGRLIRWAGTATDVHDRYLAEEARRREVSTIAEAVPQIVWSADARARLTFLNARFEEFTGISAAEALERGWEHAVPPADLATIAAQFATATAARRPMNFEHRLWHAPSRTYRSVLVRANPTLGVDGEVVNWVGTLTDVDDDRRAHDRDHTVSEAFQRASLPRALPDLPGLRFCAEYFAAGEEALVGGDWYDAFALTDGRVVVSVGDVMGSGLDSAVTMAAARQAIRGAAQIYPDPIAVLDAADRALSSEQRDRIVTAFVGVFEPITGVFAYASAGHPGPLLRRPDGTILELSDGGLPLGLRAETPSTREPTRTTMLEPGALLVLYTDGLTEATRDTALGESRLRAAVAEARIDTADNIARFIRTSVLAHQPADDVAIMTMSCETRAPDDVWRWTISTTDAEAAVRLRRDIATILRASGDGETGDAELILGELLGNVVRHTRGDVEVVLDGAGEYPIVHVLDRGPGFTFVARLPQDVLSESGRGLFIASMLARDLTVVRRPDGGSHARAVLPYRKARPRAFSER